MALRQPASVFASSSRLLSSRSSFICASCTRQTRLQSTDASASASATSSDAHPPSNALPPRNPRVPQPTPFVPDPPTFLKLIGRSLSNHASKFASWEEMFTLSSTQLRDRGLEPPRTRKYFLRWRQKFRNGDYGVGGDLKYVTDGTAELRVCEVPSFPQRESPAASMGEAQDAAAEGGKKVFASTTHTPGFTRLILNVPKGATTYVLGQGEKTGDLKKPKGMKLKEGRLIVGQYVMPVKGSQGSVATISVTEGMWEDRRGHKVHGGERRRAETLHKMRVAESKKARR